jgi:hypothetical protein
MIKRVSKFQTSDGHLFDDEVAAKQHDLEVETYNALYNVLKNSVNTGRLEAVLKHLMVVEEPVREILVRYHRRHNFKLKEAA